MTDAAVTSRPAQGRLDLSTKLYYGVGSVAFGVKDNGFSYMLLLFYNQVVGLSATQVGLALMIALLFDAVIDPLIGHISDNFRSPWGRRHPFMYAAALPLAVCYVAIWNPPHWSPQALFYYLLAMAIVIRTFVSFYEVPSSAMAAEFSSSYDERSVLLSYRFFFAWIGGLSIQLLAFSVLLKPDAAHKVGQLNPVGYAQYGLVGAVVIFLAILISAAGTHRYIGMLRAAPPRRNLSLRQAGQEIVQTLSNRSFLYLLASNIATAMAAGLAASLNGYFNTYFWGFSASQISLFTAGVFMSAILALSLAPYFSRRFGKRSTAMAVMVLALVFGIGPLLLRLARLFPANGTDQLVWAILCTSIISTTFGIVASTMGSSMIADVVEAAELTTGRRSEGLFFAASAFVGKSVSGFGILAAASLIDFIGLKNGADPSSLQPETIRNLAVFYCPLITVLYLIGLILLFGYRISRTSHLETLGQLGAGTGPARAQ